MHKDLQKRLGKPEEVAFLRGRGFGPEFAEDASEA
jgi:hypothetical protein